MRAEKGGSMDGQLLAVVSADAGYRTAVVQALTGEGYRVLTVPPGAEDYGAIRKARPALVILTLSAALPESGWTLYTGVRLGWDTRNVAVLLCFQNAAFLQVKKSELRRLHSATVSPDLPMSALVAKVQSMIGPALPIAVERWGDTWMG